jgi:hypothetical protein
VPVANDADPGRHAPRIPRDGKTDQPGRAIAVFTIGKPSTCDGAPATLRVLEQRSDDAAPALTSTGASYGARNQPNRTRSQARLNLVRETVCFDAADRAQTMDLLLHTPAPRRWPYIRFAGRRCRFGSWLSISPASGWSPSWAPPRVGQRSQRLSQQRSCARCLRRRCQNRRSTCGSFPVP